MGFSIHHMDTQDGCEGGEKTREHISEWRLSILQGVAVKG